MQDTRKQILEILKLHGEVTVQELSQELGLTSVTVRHHLEILRSDGYITEPEIHRCNRPGRPRYTYRLTSTAADLFPNNYSGLAEVLLDVFEECVPPELREHLLDEAAQRFAGETTRLPAGPAERMDYVITALKRLGFVARWEMQESGCCRIYVSNCPYHYVAHAHPITCQIDRRVIQLLTGAHVVKIQGHAHEGALCVYEVRWDAPPPA